MGLGPKAIVAIGREFLTISWIPISSGSDLGIAPKQSLDPSSISMWTSK